MKVTCQAAARFSAAADVEKRKLMKMLLFGAVVGLPAAAGLLIPFTDSFATPGPESSNAGRDWNLEGGMRGNSQFCRFTKIEFPNLEEKMSKGGCLTLMWHRQFVKFIGDDVDWNEYIDAFDRLLCIINLEEDQCISFFLAGLSSEIELPVRMFKPRTLAEVYGLCKLEEAKVNAATYSPTLKSSGWNLSTKEGKSFLEVPQKVSYVGCMAIKCISKHPELSSMVLCVYPTTTLHLIKATESQQVPEKITELLHQYADVFAIPMMRVLIVGEKSIGAKIQLKGAKCH
ncbi:hypothetical protein Tco_0867848 [Tanacetum coccineum]